MLKVALLLEEVIKEYFNIYIEEEIKLDRLNTDEQATLYDIKDFLAILKSTTKSLEGHYYRLNKVILSMDFILSQYKKAKLKYTNHDVLKNIVNSRQQKIEKYQSKTDESPAYAAAIHLYLS